MWLGIEPTTKSRQSNVPATRPLSHLYGISNFCEWIKRTCRRAVRQWFARLSSDWDRPFNTATMLFWSARCPFTSTKLCINIYKLLLQQQQQQQTTTTTHADTTPLANIFGSMSLDNFLHHRPHYVVHWTQVRVEWSLVYRLSVTRLCQQLEVLVHCLKLRHCKAVITR